MAAPQPPPQGQLPRYPYAQPPVPNGITPNSSQPRPYPPYIPSAGLPPVPPQSTPRGQMPPWSSRPPIPGQTSAFYPVQQPMPGNTQTSQLGSGSPAAPVSLATMNASLSKSPMVQSSPNLVPLVNGSPRSVQAPNLPRPSSFAGPTVKDSNLLLPPGFHHPTENASLGATPNSSAPPSNRTSRNVSPAPSSKYDNMEGQFPPSAATSPLGSSTNLNGTAEHPAQMAPPPPQSNFNQAYQAPPSSLPQSQTQQLPSNPPTQPPFRAPAPSAYYSAPPSQPQAPPPQRAPYWNNPVSASNTVSSPTIVSQPGLMQPLPPSGYTTPYRPPTGAVPPSTPQYLPPTFQIQSNRYPLPPGTNHTPNSGVDQLNPAFNAMGIQPQTVQQGFNALWGTDNIDLLQSRNILPPDAVKPPTIRLAHEYMNNVNCSPDIFRCTLTKIPETNALLQKSRLPLGVLIHPFKDLNQLPVIQCQNIVRCRSCRTYINPFVYFVDQRRWKCNLCFRVNELPDEFQFDPMTKTYGDPSRRPEVKNATIEFIAPSEYMLRPPQPAIYLYVLDVSHNAVETGYLKVFCDTLIEELDKVPGDTRTQMGFITFDSTIHFYNLAEGRSQPHQMIVTDIDDVFLPCPSDLLVHLNTSKQLILDFLEDLPTRFLHTRESSSALGAALQAAYKLVSPIGGRVTVMQSTLPTAGPASLKPREDPNQRAAKDVSHLNPAIDFYKKLALDCSGQQVAVDIFLFGSQYVDIATLSCAAKFSGGCIYHFPGFHYIQNAVQAERFERCLRRYLTRKVGFEAVMRIRCTRGLTIHTFHGNFFVRSTDLLSLPNVNPDAGFGMQVSIEENLSDVQNVCFQAALLYTSSKGERRIRVHTMCLPLAGTVADIIQSADQQCIVGLLAKMAVDRSLSSSINDARDAFINVCIDSLSAYKATQSLGSSGLIAPQNLRLLPMYVLALLKSYAFRSGTSTRLDDRVYAMCQMKTLPLAALIQAIYPDLYAVHNLTDQGAISVEDVVVPQPPRLQLSAEKVDSTGCYVMDTGDIMYIYVGKAVSTHFCQAALGSPSYQALPEQMFELPEVDTPDSERLRSFVNYLQNQKPYPAVLQLIREDSKQRGLFIERLIEDRTESALSYYEFLQHLKSSVK